MALWILQSVLLAFGVEMRPRGLEIRCLAFCVLMKMRYMFSGWQSGKVKLDRDAIFLTRQSCSADALPLGVFQFDYFFFSGESDHRQCQDEPE